MPLIIYVYGVNEDQLIIKMFALFLAAAIQFNHGFVLEKIQQSVLMFRQPNATEVGFHMYKDIPYEDCRCNIISIDTCLTNLQFKFTRILPLILFLLEVYTFKDLLSLNRFRRHFIVKFYWIISIFLFFCVVMIIYQSSDYYIIMTTLLSELGIVLAVCCGASVVRP
jgi:small-conductance mechanosensitive channel